MGLDSLGNVIEHFHPVQENFANCRIACQAMSLNIGNAVVKHADPGRNPIDGDLTDTPESLGSTAGFIVVFHYTSPEILLNVPVGISNFVEVE
jgi:hypothetical protein